VRAIGGWLVDFWGLWCRIMVEVGCISFVVLMVVGDRGCGNWGGSCSLAEVAGVGCWGAAASDPMVSHVTALVDGGCQQYIAIMLVSHAPC
jgi:hypothetical protein